MLLPFRATWQDGSSLSLGVSFEVWGEPEGGRSNAGGTTVWLHGAYCGPLGSPCCLTAHLHSCLAGQSTCLSAEEVFLFCTLKRVPLKTAMETAACP